MEVRINFGIVIIMIYKVITLTIKILLLLLNHSNIFFMILIRLLNVLFDYVYTKHAINITIANKSFYAKYNRRALRRKPLPLLDGMCM